MGKWENKRSCNPLNRQVVQHVHRPWLVICIRNTKKDMFLQLKFVDRVRSYVFLAWCFCHLPVLCINYGRNKLYKVKRI